MVEAIFGLPLEESGETSETELLRVFAPVLDTVVTKCIRPFSYPLMAQILQMLCVFDEKEASNRLKMALSHNAMMHAPLMALQGGRHVRARRSPMAPTIVINGVKYLKNW